MSRRALPILVFVAALLLAGLAWAAGFATAVIVEPPTAIAPADVEAPPNFSLFNEAWSVVDREFYGTRPAAGAVADGAVSGLVAALGDPYATYISASEAGQDQGLGHPLLLAGVGAWVEPVTDGALVLAVLPGSPAEAAELAPGDRLLATGDTPLARLDASELRDALEGEPGTEVLLVYQRGEGQPESVELTRAAVDLADLAQSRPRPTVAVLRPSHLDAAVLAELDRALAGLATDPADALVLDLRDNPGGDANTVRALAGRFFEGEAWVEVDREGVQTVREADGRGAPAFPRPDKLVVLTNAGTAGGAEMLAGALRDRAGARIIGQPTFGQGKVQGLVRLADGSLLRMTVAEWRTPGGASVAEGGLQPDERVEGAAAQLEAALRAAGAAAAAGG